MPDKAKRSIGVLLLLFAAASLVVLGVKEQGRPDEDARRPTQSGAATSDQSDRSDRSDRSDEPDQPPSGDRVVAYYLHGNFRCASCNTIEKWSGETIRSAFGREIAAGNLEFRPVNYEEPGNEHFVTDYQLHTQSLVLVAYVDGKGTRHVNLTRVWELLRDESAFRKYVRDGVRDFLKGDQS
jgi:hypothetical protein